MKVGVRDAQPGAEEAARHLAPRALGRRVGDDDTELDSEARGVEEHLLDDVRVAVHEHDIGRGDALDGVRDDRALGEVDPLVEKGVDVPAEQRLRLALRELRRREHDVPLQPLDCVPHRHRLGAAVDEELYLLLERSLQLSREHLPLRAREVGDHALERGEHRSNARVRALDEALRHLQPDTQNGRVDVALRDSRRRQRRLALVLRQVRE